jgi:hypothetical protein
VLRFGTGLGAQTYKADLELFKWEFKKCDEMVKNVDEQVSEALPLPKQVKSWPDASRWLGHKLLML